VDEVNRFNDLFYSYVQILWRVVLTARNTRDPKKLLGALVMNLSDRSNHLLDRRIYADRIQSFNLRHVSAAGADSILPAI
jgi:hypothetical protein